MQSRKIRVLILIPVFLVTIASAFGASGSVDLDSLRKNEKAIIHLVDKLSPQVVAITAGREIRLPRAKGKTTSQQYETILVPVRGSGCIISRDGQIITNEHLIRRTKLIKVTLWNGREYQAKLVASDPRSDLAVIKIDKKHLPFVRFGDLSTLRRGQFVLVMGNPLGLAFDGQAAVSFGIISAIGRHVPDIDRKTDRNYGNLIQTTAQISVGNSGSPLFNLDGQVVGINTIISSASVGGTHLGFAIPISRWTRNIIEKLRAGESIEYGYLGILLTNRPGEQGAVVVEVLQKSPAGRAGIKPKDLILEYDGEKIINVNHLIMLIGQTEPGKKISLRINRAEKHRR